MKLIPKNNSVVDGNNKNLIFNEQGTILEVILDKPLNPGKKLKLTFLVGVKFHCKFEELEDIIKKT